MNTRRTRQVTTQILIGLDCQHPRFTECHPGCGNYHCPDCGLEWDDGCDFPQDDPPVDAEAICNQQQGTRKP